MEVEQPAPRAFYPDYVDRAPRPARTPGWNLETERRLDDGRALTRTIVLVSVGLSLLGLLALRKFSSSSDV
jgi:hypothetical protein